MDAHKVEAMLLEANINTSSSCFGISTNTTKIHEVKDKTKINYWYKLPFELLMHFACFIFSGEDLSDASGVDLTVRGDHGKEFLKLIVRFVDTKPPFSILFQVANVDYPKDDIDVL
jgi:hypothetical protein